MDVKNKNRNVVIDIIKAIGIISVVLSHTFDYGTRPRNFLFIFHLPLFFIVSGYLYKNSKDPWSFIGKKLSSFLKLYLLYNIIFLVFHNLFFKMGILENSSLYNLRDFVVNFLNFFLFQSSESFSGPMWFVPVLFVSLVIYNFITHFIYRENIFKSEIYRTWAVVFCALLGFYLNSRHINIGLNYQSCFLIMPFIHFGQLFKLYFKDKIKPDIVISIFLLLNSIGFFMNVGGSVDIAFGYYWHPILFFIIPTALVYVIYTFSYYVSHRENIISRVLAFIGCNSFHIMALHVMFFKLFDFVFYKLFKPDLFPLNRFPISINRFNFIYTILSIICSLLVVKLIEIIKKNFVSKFKFY